MELLGLFFEIIFWLFGVFMYFLAIGKVPISPRYTEVYQNFQKMNGTWLRYVALLLIAMMTVNIGLHLTTLFRQ